MILIASTATTDSASASTPALPERHVAADYVELTLHFKCNLKCRHCMIEDSMDWLEPESMQSFAEILATNLAERRWKGIIFTGAEITLRADLPELARRARASGFEHVRIQTHGMRLANKAYCHELVAAGIDEYFVSVTAADAQTHDFITGAPGSFEKTLRGLENLDAEEGVTILTNTVITTLSYRQLPEVVTRLAHLRRLSRMEFWNYWPMSEADDKDLVASHVEILPYLKEALARTREHGISLEVKNFPECLLGEDRSVLNNDQPKLLIDPEFWPEFMRNGFDQCVHRAYCGAQHCLGLNTAYVAKFGWQADLLVPLEA